MTLRVFWIPGPWSGRLGIVPRPRGGDWLDEEAQSWRAAGIDLVVSLLQPEEEAEFELESEHVAALSHGVDFEPLPIPDRGLPSSKADVTSVAVRLLHALRDGKSVAVHCRQGIGRSSIVAAAVLILAGARPSEALGVIARSRGAEVPETDEQRRWVDEFARSPAG